MKKRNIKITIITLGILILFIVPISYAIFRNSSNATGSLSLATWSVTLNQEGVNDTLVVIPSTQTDATYTLNIESDCEVDIKYSIMISNLPSGVEVSFDGGDFEEQDENNTITFTDVGTILYTDSEKNQTKTLTFRGKSNAEIVENQEVNIDVVVRQIV